MFTSYTSSEAQTARNQSREDSGLLDDSITDYGSMLSGEAQRKCSPQVLPLTLFQSLSISVAI